VPDIIPYSHDSSRV